MWYVRPAKPQITCQNATLLEITCRSSYFSTYFHFLKIFVSAYLPITLAMSNGSEFSVHLQSLTRHIQVII